jgi:dihydrodipicolinate reductase
MSKPIIVVFGATGKTGGGMVEAILTDGSFQARAVTRDPNSASGKGTSTVIKASEWSIDKV